MPTIAETVPVLFTRDVPVLFLDTCVLLDVVRATQRRLKTTVADATELLRSLRSSPPLVSLVLASFVPMEWNNNIDTTVEEVRKHLELIQDQSEHFYDACQALGLLLPFSRPNYPLLSLHQKLRTLSQSLIESSFTLETDRECLLQATSRLAQKLAPSRNSSELKDCVIFEECLEVTRQLRAAGFSRPCVFCTSNTRDYGKPEDNGIPEFSDPGLNLAFTTTLSWARSQLTT